MTPPARTLVMGQPFEVIVDAHLMVEREDGSTAHVLGTCDADAQIVVLDTEGVGQARLRETYLHEHLHAMMAVGGFRDLLDGDTEERVAKRLAPILLLFLRDNPDVYTYLTEVYE